MITVWSSPYPKVISIIGMVNVASVGQVDTTLSHRPIGQKNLGNIWSLSQYIGAQIQALPHWSLCIKK